MKNIILFSTFLTAAHCISMEVPEGKNQQNYYKAKYQSNPQKFKNDFSRNLESFQHTVDWKCKVTDRERKKWDQFENSYFVLVFWPYLKAKTSNEAKPSNEEFDSYKKDKLKLNKVIKSFSEREIRDHGEKMEIIQKYFSNDKNLIKKPENEKLTKKN